MNKKTKEEIANVHNAEEQGNGKHFAAMVINVLAEEKRRKAWEAEIGDPMGLMGDDYDWEF